MDPPLTQRMRYIRDHLRQPIYLGLFLLFSILYIELTAIVVLYIHKSFAGFYQGMYPSYTIPYTLFGILLGLLFGISMTLAVAKFREMRLKSAGFGVTGVLFGSLAAGCPGCFFGLFPLVLSIFGISATLAILPFNGLELQLVAILALGLSTLTLAKETVIVCKL